ncbi:PEP-CTERM sorting domain-containing protein [Massilia puerhi]|uniref:PEP-CTERM sorting domain-containing protein n=1 Tax=Massilia puerhi TaxID=2681550 RepID=UPI00135BC0CB|nr:PEP-CTERM sorting domain-containing protein [Massilia puerhi]
MARQQPSSATKILFVGNSFTYGDPAGAAPLVQDFRPHTVSDLNGTGLGGVPALFKAMTDAVGLRYDVSLETEGGKGLDFHHDTRHATIVKPWDIVLLQGYSTLDEDDPGNPAKLIRFSGLLAQALHRQNPAVDVRLTATWSRADQTWLAGGAWHGEQIDRMALDVRHACDAAAAASHPITGVIPVGQAWNRAIALGVACTNPYRALAPGEVNLWAPDAYHGSVHGYYLEAATIFGQVTGRDPRLLGAFDPIARELGIEARMAGALQAIAAAQLAVEDTPEQVRRAA